MDHTTIAESRDPQFLLAGPPQPPSPGLLASSQYENLPVASNLPLLATAYNGPLIPRNDDRSAFAPPKLTHDHTVADTEAKLASDNAKIAPDVTDAGAKFKEVDPRNYPGRTIVLCFDGTNQKYGLENTNVVKLFSVLSKGDETRQLVYYHSGIGTYTPAAVSRTLEVKDKTVDKVFANNLHHHVMDGYEFLMHECEYSINSNTFTRFRSNPKV